MFLVDAIPPVAAAAPAPAHILPWEIAVAEIESGRLRGLAERLSKQNLLYQLHLGEVTKDDLVETSQHIDRILASLSAGSPAYSVPAPWTPEIRAQLRALDDLWGPIRRMAVASPYDYLRVARQFMQPEDRRGDPLVLRYFDSLVDDFIAADEKLIKLYDSACRDTGLEVCDTAAGTGYASMVIERAIKQAVFIVAGIDVEQNRARLKDSIATYQKIRHDNDTSPFFAAALNPERGVSAAAAHELLSTLRKDWDQIQVEFTILSAGDEKNFDLDHLLEVQSELVDKVDRLTGALIRYASVTYGG
jgi:hypothetical protein